jgi:hypothetical protein
VLCAGPARALESEPWIGIYADGVLAGSLSCGLGLLCDNPLGIATLLTDWTVVTLGGDVITLDGTGEDATMLDPDPQIVYGSTVIDNGAPTTFNFVFALGIVATAAPGVVSHTLSSNTTDGAGGGGVTASAAAAPAGIQLDSDGIPEISKYNLSLDGGTTFLSADHDLQAGFFSGAPGTSTQGPYTEGGAGPSTAGNFYNFMRVDVNVSLSGGGDRYGFNGKATIEEDANVPEPTTGALLGLGLIGFALRKRRAAVQLRK